MAPDSGHLNFEKGVLRLSLGCETLALETSSFESVRTDCTANSDSKNPQSRIPDRETRIRPGGIHALKARIGSGPSPRISRLEPRPGAIAGAPALRLPPGGAGSPLDLAGVREPGWCFLGAAFAESRESLRLLHRRHARSIAESRGEDAPVLKNSKTLAREIWCWTSPGAAPWEPAAAYVSSY